MAVPSPGGPPCKAAGAVDFGRLHQQIEQAAAGFALGVRPGEVVGLFSENSPAAVADQG